MSNWCWAHWITLTWFIVSWIACSFDRIHKRGLTSETAGYIAANAVLTIFSVYVLHAGGFW